MARRWLLGVAFVAASTILAAPPTRAGIVVTAENVNGDLVVEGSGTADLAGLDSSSSGSTLGQSDSGAGTLLVGPDYGSANASYDGYTGLTGPTSFGSWHQTNVASPGYGSSDIFGILNGGTLVVPSGYKSGTELSGSMTFIGAGQEMLGMTVGTYKWTWGSGTNADFLTLTVGHIVPEPSSLTMAAIAAGQCGWTARRRRGRTATA